MSPQETTCQTTEVNQPPEIFTTCLVPFLLTGLGTTPAGFHIDGVCGPHCVELVFSVPAAQTARQSYEAEE